MLSLLFFYHNSLTYHFFLMSSITIIIHFLREVGCARFQNVKLSGPAALQVYQHNVVILYSPDKSQGMSVHVVLYRALKN